MNCIIESCLTILDLLEVEKCFVVLIFALLKILILLIILVIGFKVIYFLLKCNIDILDKKKNNYSIHPCSEAPCKVLLKLLPRIEENKYKERKLSEVKIAIKTSCLNMKEKLMDMEKYSPIHRMQFVQTFIDMELVFKTMKESTAELALHLNDNQGLLDTFKEIEAFYNEAKTYIGLLIDVKEIDVNELKKLFDKLKEYIEVFSGKVNNLN